MTQTTAQVQPNRPDPETSQIARLPFSDLLQDLIQWWYIEQPKQYILKLKRAMVVVNDRISLTLLFKTFFIPWHRDSSPVGYFMGILIRLLYLPIALTWYMFVFGLGILGYILWMLLPVISLLLILISPFA